MGEVMEFIEKELGVAFNSWQHFHGELILRRMDGKRLLPIVTQVLSGRGVGKTYMAAALSLGLARLGHTTAVYTRCAQHTAHIGRLLESLGAVVEYKFGGAVVTEMRGSIVVRSRLDRGYPRVDITFVDDCDGGLWWHHAEFHRPNTDSLVFLETDEIR